MESRFLIVFLFGLSLSFWSIADTDAPADDKAVKTEEAKDADKAKSEDAEETDTEEVKVDAEEETSAEDEKSADVKKDEPAAKEKTEEVEVEEVVVEEVPAAEDKKEEVKKEEPAAEEKAEEVKKEEPAEKEAAEEEKAEKPAEQPVVEAAPAAVVQPEQAAPAEEKEKTCPCACYKIGRAILLYIPNRILDLNDSFTMDMGVGTEAGANLTLTRYFQLGGIHGSKYYLTKGYNSQYGGGYLEGWNYSFAPPTSDESRFLDESFGTVKEFIIKKKGLHIPTRDEEAYIKNYRDFWSVGVAGGWLLTFNLEMHPVDFADFMTGLFLYDFKENDLQ